MIKPGYLPSLTIIPREVSLRRTATAMGMLISRHLAVSCVAGVEGGPATLVKMALVQALKGREWLRGLWQQGRLEAGLGEQRALVAEICVHILLVVVGTVERYWL